MDGRPSTLINNKFVDSLVSRGIIDIDTFEYWSDKLEEKEGPYVICFCQLPFVIDEKHLSHHISGWRKNVIFDLCTKKMTLSSTYSNKTFCNEPQVTINCTRVIGLVKLWGRRQSVYSKYINHVINPKLNNVIVGKVPRLSYYLGQQPKIVETVPVTCEQFESNVAHALRHEFIYVINKYIKAIEISNLVKIPAVKELFGYFVMVSPNRIASAGVPKSVELGYLKSTESLEVKISKNNLFDSLLRNPSVLPNTIVNQLQAMNMLLRQGEPELALIGCITSLEWYLNDTFNLVKTTKNGELRSMSISEMINNDSLIFLGPDLLRKFKEYVQLRNKYAHGEPPNRSSENRITSSKSEQIRGALFLALEIYRKVNIYKGVNANLSCQEA